jgi:hypothetical protein
VKTFVHARLTASERRLLDRMRKVTGRSESALVRRGLQLVAAEEQSRRSALDLAGASVGRFDAGPGDLAANRRHLEDFGR